MAANDVLINGMALNNQGTTDTNAVNGYGINTFGFVWGCSEFWYGPYYSNGLTGAATWSLFPGATTCTWSLVAGVSTTWSLFTTGDQSCLTES